MLVQNRKEYKKYSKSRIASFLVLLSCILTASCSIQENIVQEEQDGSPRRVKADNISIDARDLPEFKTDPHIKESEGNQIFGVVRTMLQDKNGDYWFGGQGGLAHYDGQKLVYYELKDDFGRGITVKILVQDRLNNLWIGHSGGVTKYDGEYFINFSQQDGLVSNDVWSLAADSSGIIWVGTIEGVNCFDGTTFTSFNIPEAKPDSTRGVTSSKIVHHIMEDSKGRMWFGTNGGVHVYDGKLLRNISEKEGLCNNAVVDILEDKDGNMWFATTHNGICFYDGESFTTIAKDKEVGTVLQDSNGLIWFATKGDGMYHYDGESLTNLETDEGGSGLLTFDIYEDQMKQIWAVGFKGAFRYDRNSFVNVTRNGPWGS